MSGSSLLVLDVGNTNTVLGLYRGDELVENWRVATNPASTTDETGVLCGMVTRLLALLGGNGLELLDGPGEMGVHLVHVGLVDLLESLEASEKVSLGRRD